LPDVDETQMVQSTSQQKIVVTMSANTVTSLNASGAAVVLFKAVSNSDAATRPLLWARFSTISPQMTFTVGSQTNFFTSIQQTIAEGKVIDIGAQAVGQAGQIYNILENSGGGGNVKSGGSAGAFSFDNQTGVQMTCGLMQEINGTAEPYCAVPLYGKAFESFVACDQVLLGVSSAALDVGSYVSKLTQTPASIASTSFYKSFAITSNLLMVTLDAASPRAISYDVNSGWDFDNNTWARMVPATTQLKDVLVV